jgi:hypothetical protein
VTVERSSIAQSNRRLWRDLSKKRLLIGLALSPLGPWIIGVVLIAALGGEVGFGILGVLIVGALAAAMVWSLIGGGAYVFLISRWRGAVRRAECFLLGIVLAASLPFAAEYAGRGVDWITGTAAEAEPPGDDMFEAPTDLAFAVVASILLVPFGALGGWVFWRVGVRPAQPKLADVAPVFD